MAEVNVENDEIRRFVVRHYRYDPDRRERRFVVVAAFDNVEEFEAQLNELSDVLNRNRDSSEDFDPRESISGVIFEPGHHALQQNAHLLKRAIAHGRVPPEVAELPLPSNVAFVRFDSEPD